MALDNTLSPTPCLVSAAYRFSVSFPIACFFLTVLTDIAYWQTSNLLWLHFSEWLLLAGLVFGCLAFVLALVALSAWKAGPSWLSYIGGAVVLLAAALNSFIHTADGWTAVMPYGLATSLATVAAMAVTAWLARREVPHV